MERTRSGAGYHETLTRAATSIIKIPQYTTHTKTPTITENPITQTKGTNPQVQDP